MFVVLGHRHNGLAQPFARHIQVDYDFPRIRMQRFFLTPAFFIEPEHFGERERVQDFLPDGQFR